MNSPLRVHFRVRFGNPCPLLSFRWGFLSIYISQECTKFDLFTSSLCMTHSILSCYTSHAPLSQNRSHSCWNPDVFCAFLISFCASSLICYHFGLHCHLSHCRDACAFSLTFDTFSCERILIYHFQNHSQSQTSFSCVFWTFSSSLVTVILTCMYNELFSINITCTGNHSLLVFINYLWTNSHFKSM